MLVGRIWGTLFMLVNEACGEDDVCGTNAACVCAWGLLRDRVLTAMVLEWVSRGSLQDIIGDPNMSWETPLLRLMTDVARGMSYLHNRKWFDEVTGKVHDCVMHRDLKPENVSLTVCIVTGLPATVCVGMCYRQVQRKLTHTCNAPCHCFRWLDAAHRSL